MSRTRHARRPAPETTCDRILGVMRGGALYATPAELQQWLGVSRQSIDTALHRLVARGQVERVDRGLYKNLTATPTITREARP